MQNFVLRAKKAVKKIAAIGAGVAMVGATVGSAFALDLAEYPSPFIVNGKYDNSNVFVVGANAASSDSIGVLDIGTGLQFESKTCTAGGGAVSVSGGTSEQIPLGSAVADANSYTFDTELSDGDIPTLLDTTISFNSADYDIQENIAFATGNATIATSLTSADDDYETSVVMEMERDAVKYFYLFDETIIPNASTTSIPLDIKFLGKKLKITNIGSDTKFTAYVGTEYFMQVEDGVEVDGKKITLKNVGSNGAIVVDVDGVVETIPSSTVETVNGIEIKNDETFYDSNDVAQRSATLVIGKDAQETYQDGDAYVGEDKDDPNWVWDLGSLNGEAASSLTTTTADATGPKLGIENDFVWNDDSDNPLSVGECLDLPNNYVSICLDSLSVADTNYMTLTQEYDSSADLSDACGGCTALSAAGAVYIHSNVDDSLVVDQGDLTGSNGSSSDRKTDKIWITNLNAATAAANDTEAFIYYEDTNNKVIWAGHVILGTTPVNFGHIEYDSTKGTDAIFKLTNSTTTGLNIALYLYDATYLANVESINSTWITDSNGKVTALGATASSEEAGELVWQGTNLGTKDEDHRTQYGVIVRDPKGHGASDEVVLEVPGDQVFANVVIKGTSATSAASSTNCAITPIETKSMMDSEVTSPANYNLIVVGGPAINSVAEKFVGTADNFRELYSAGEALIKIAANGDKVAIVVAGYEAMDTRRAAKVLQNFKDYKLSGTEVVVKGTTLSDMTVAAA
ncbi:MAG: hypothetical protein PHE43_02925 [Candidatus Nanoarchaeia archaeon]|nr:hypothetical protein [Candidatus Nanoarchaeia archaeon]